MESMEYRNLCTRVMNLRYARIFSHYFVNPVRGYPLPAGITLLEYRTASGGGKILWDPNKRTLCKEYAGVASLSRIWCFLHFCLSRGADFWCFSRPFGPHSTWSVRVSTVTKTQKTAGLIGSVYYRYVYSLESAEMAILTVLELPLLMRSIILFL